MKNRRFAVSEDLVQRLAAAGCPVSASRDFEKAAAAISHRLLILQDGGLLESRAIETDCGGTAFTIGVQVGCDLPRITIYRWEVELPWEDPQFLWLSDPGENKFSPSVYTLTGTSERFPRELVINHRSVLTRGRTVCGLLLGFGFERIPDRYRHGNSIEVRLSLVDHVGRSFPSSFSLWVDRSVRSRPKRVIKHRDLGVPQFVRPSKSSETASVSRNEDNAQETMSTSGKTAG
jgi:hypothetical protein